MPYYCLKKKEKIHKAKSLEYCQVNGCPFHRKVKNIKKHASNSKANQNQGC